MKYLIFIYFLFVFYIPSSDSQPLVVNWQQCIGGSSFEVGMGISKDYNGFYLVCGTSSNNGQIIGNHGKIDFWFMQTDSFGNIKWEKTYGGSDDDVPRHMKPTPDGGFIIIGETFSNDAQVQGNHGGSDFWVVKIDSLGNIQWQKCLGGSSLDFGRDIDLTSDSGYLCFGYSGSTDGDVTGNHGYYDYWLVKLDKNGNIKWERSYGGSSFEFGLGITSTNDGGAILAGNTGSTDGDVQCAYHGGNADAWIVKLDSSGEIQWQQCYGGSLVDNVSIILPLADGGYLCVGNTASNDGQVSGNHGSFDFWIFKIDHLGNLLTQKCFGGSSDDTPDFLRVNSDGNYIVGGYTFSNDGDVSGNHSNPGLKDMWLIKLNPDLNLIWQQCIGGNGNEECNDFLDISGGRYILLGYSGSDNNTGEVKCHQWGGEDIWLVSVTDTTYIGINENKQPKYSIWVYPNPASQEVEFELIKPQDARGALLRIFNDLGEFMVEFSFNGVKDKFIWNTIKMAPGLYFYQLFEKDQIASGKFFIIH